ncbi:response regulator [Halogeometricum borinquense]|uniref:Response regulator n=1 Tax=Halogeometricum borinquense TaxID=60847 RepID=A0A6C0UHC3_9EURY|nr:hybrid sensor histidine kinase/response regulator [Halogeometricum borinquense]QIB73199.1 response regulator [Halogeometricum borinquense]QIQ77405.1 response regulator [Halogeometricum borinquense]
MDRRARVLFVAGDDDPAAVPEDNIGGDEAQFKVERVGELPEARLDSGAYDCIVCNYVLATRDGVELTAELRDSYPTLPIIVYTAVGDETVARDALRAGATDYVVSDETENSNVENDEATALRRRIEAAIADGRETQRIERTAEAATQLEKLTRVLTHDIRNDLSVIVGWADILRNSVTEDGEEVLERILDNGRKTLELTDVARDAVEMIVGGGADEIEPTYLNGVLHGTVQDRRERYPEATIELGSVPSCHVAANSLLGAVFRNLLNDALSHQSGDDPSVHISAERTGDVVQVRVTDDSGASDARREAAFNNAELGSPDTDISVFLVETLVAAYGGDVWVEDDGAVFVVELRVVD